MAEKVTTKTDLKNNKYKQVAAAWGADEDDVKKFMIAMERTKRMVPGVGGPRPMIIRDRKDHRTGQNLMLNPDAAEAAHKLFLKYSQKESQ